MRSKRCARAVDGSRRCSRIRGRCARPFAEILMHRWRLIVLIALAFVSLAHAETATRVKEFEGAEDPKKKYNVAADRIENDDFENITDVGDNTVRMTLRFRPGEWWDGD